MKIIKKLNILSVLLVLTLIYRIPCYSHNLETWVSEYGIDHAVTYHFALVDVRHIDGNIVYYRFSNSTSRAAYATAVASAINSWGGIISGEETSTLYAAHVKLVYKSTPHPDGYAGLTDIDPKTSTNYHIRKDSISKDAKITFYYENNENRKMTAAHELGHLWGIADLYNSYWGPSFSGVSIYGGSTNSFTMPTRNDRNALRIGAKDFWFETDEVWFYHKDATHKYLRADVDQDGDITPADARLILRYSIQLETPTDLQKKLADVDGDGEITPADAREVNRYAVGLILKFPADNVEFG